METQEDIFGRFEDRDSLNQHQLQLKEVSSGHDLLQVAILTLILTAVRIKLHVHRAALSSFEANYKLMLKEDPEPAEQASSRFLMPLCCEISSLQLSTYHCNSDGGEHRETI